MRVAVSATEEAEFAQSKGKHLETVSFLYFISSNHKLKK
jgi:hypothetical protein